MKDMRVALGILGLAAILLGCGGGEEKAERRSGGRIDPASIKKISSSSVDEVWRSVGTVVSKTTSRIGSKVPGYVEEVKVGEGDLVKAGDVLLVVRSDELKARMDGAEAGVQEAQNGFAEAQAGLDEVKAQKDLAEITYQRYAQLMERQSVSRQEFDEVTARYEKAKARLRRAEEGLARAKTRVDQAGSSLQEARSYYEYTRIRGLIDGIVSEKAVNEGDLVVPGTTLLAVESRELYRLETAVDESQAAHIRLGDTLEVRLGAGGGRDLSGTVSEIVPRVDPVTRTFLVRIDLPAMEGIRSGMYGTAYFRLGVKDVLLVPKLALLECGQLASLFVINAQGTVERRLVKTGKEYKEQVEILSGLEPGESIVTEGVESIAESCTMERRP